MDYLVPGRRSRREAARSDANRIVEPSFDHNTSHSPSNLTPEPLDDVIPQLTVRPPRGSISTRALASHQETKRKTRPIASRSFSNLKSAVAESPSSGYYARGLPKSSSSTALVGRRGSLESNDGVQIDPSLKSGMEINLVEGDASEMRQRSAQKTFVHVKIPRCCTVPLLC